MIQVTNEGFIIIMNDKTFLSHTKEEPAFLIGDKQISYEMDKGEFKIVNNTIYRPAKLIKASETSIEFKKFSLDVIEEESNIILKFKYLENPIKMIIKANNQEKIFGLGERFNGLNLRGHIVKNWVEEHITRQQIYNKILRRVVKLKPKKWPFEDYKTYFVTPTFISSDNYFCHIETNGYALFDFTNQSEHQIEVLENIESVTFSKHKSLLSTSSELSKFKGILPKLPDWSYDGIILGIQGGTEVVNEHLDKLLKANAKVCGIWSQDWCGELFTYFGKQVLWNWETDQRLYPNLQQEIKNWKNTKIKFLGYVNPYLNANEPMFQNALNQNYLVMNNDGTPFLTQATSFKFGIVDLTNPDAYNWFKSIIKTNMIDLGMSGWMADFGEYLPVECQLHNSTGETLHNVWPDLWVKLNREVLEETNQLGKILFFNRAGYSNNLKYTTLIWNGDQHVDFTDDFGMRSALRAMLSLSLSGVGYSHSDVGGYTTVPGIKRNKTLYLRWLEMNTFTPILRTHEGNKPKANIQSYSDIDTIKATSLFSNIHYLLKPFFKSLEKEYRETGTPMIRPTFMHYDMYKEDAFLLGNDLYVVPVMDNRKKTITVEFPSNGWIHLFTDALYNKGTQKIDAPIGCPPVFYKEDSSHSSLFRKITKYINQ